MLYCGWCRGSVRLYSDFYESDIIVASPLALATKLTEEEEEGEPTDVHPFHVSMACAVTSAIGNCLFSTPRQLDFSQYA